VTLTARAALPYGYPTTARPPVRQCRASRHQSEPGLATGPIAVHVDRDHGSCLPLRRRTPKQNPRAIAFCLVPLAMASQFSVPPQRGIPGATAVLHRTGLASDRAFGGVLRGRLVEDQTNGRWWIISDEHTHGVFRERLSLEVHTGRLAPDARRRLDAAERPAKPAQRQNFLSLVVTQDVGHSAGRPRPPGRCQRLGARLPHWPVFRCLRLAGFGCPPRLAPSHFLRQPRHQPFSPSSRLSQAFPATRRCRTRCRLARLAVWPRSQGFLFRSRHPGPPRRVEGALAGEPSLETPAPGSHEARCSDNGPHHRARSLASPRMEPCRRFP
jgi:hypothetical protein